MQMLIIINDAPYGSERAYLRDGDEVIIRGWCESAGGPLIGFGECTGTVLPAE